MNLTMPGPYKQKGSYPAFGNHTTQPSIEPPKKQPAYPINRDSLQNMDQTLDKRNISRPFKGKTRGTIKRKNPYIQQNQDWNQHQTQQRWPIPPDGPRHPLQPPPPRNPYGQPPGREALPTTQTPQPTDKGKIAPKNTETSETPGWVAPVIATAGVVILVLVVVLVVGFIIRRRRRNHSDISDSKTGRDYKISNRSPIAPPRPEVTFQKKTKLEKKESAEYAYIYPDDVKPDTGKRRDSNDPLPSPPGEYLDLDHYNKDDYLHPTDRQTPGGPAGDDYLRPRSDPYMYGRLNHGDKRDNSYAQLPHRQVSHDNKAFDEET